MTELKRPGWARQVVYPTPNLGRQRLCSICAFGNRWWIPVHARLAEVAVAISFATGDGSAPRNRSTAHQVENRLSDRLLFESVERLRQALHLLSFPARWSSRSAMAANGVDSRERFPRLASYTDTRCSVRAACCSRHHRRRVLRQLISLKTGEHPSRPDGPSWWIRKLCRPEPQAPWSQGASAGAHDVSSTGV